MGGDKVVLFTVGPVEMYERTLKVASKKLPYFRQQSFSDQTIESEKMIKELLNANKASVVFLASSGTGAMDATIQNVVMPEDKVLVISGGTFGKRFEEICSHYSLSYDSLVVNFDEDLGEEHFSRYEQKGYSIVLVNMNETSICKLYDMELVSAYCQRNHCFLIVDAISAFLCDHIDFEKFNIDALIISSQKALSLSPGLSIVVLSEKIVKERVFKTKPSYYFDFKNYLKDISRGQTPFTPAVGILIELNDMLRFIIERGIKKHMEEIEKRAKYFRNIMQIEGIDIPKYKLSNAVTPIIFKEKNAYDVFLKLSSEYDYYLTPSGGIYKDRLLRVSHMGDLSFDDYDRLVEYLKRIVIM